MSLARSPYSKFIGIITGAGGFLYANMKLNERAILSLKEDLQEAKIERAKLGLKLKEAEIDRGEILMKLKEERIGSLLLGSLATAMGFGITIAYNKLYNT